MAKPERSQKRLLYVVSPAKFFVTHRLPLALAARSHGFEVAVCTPDGPGVDAIQQHGLTWMDLKMDRGGMNPLRDMMTLARLCRLYRYWQPDIVHHVTLKPVLYGTVAARMARVNRVVNAISGMGYLLRAEVGRLDWQPPCIDYVFAIATWPLSSKILMTNIFSTATTGPAR
ncbi:glycosyltransferase family 4 protein [Hankyongella ginsenosidimutans]|uniref:Glycosyltransferase family 4 protein n=1 Tax=Hankyongella ginsenosidimutans TaxID=1763828 RepID=A0A4D7C8X9_9SPHN|nr:glycosyltransferase [Hankyongella ginsenosidimutans]QCI79223.1 glycosyltransferase family 4 protein [Hankyongella ginsenosidimutans]